MEPRQVVDEIGRRKVRTISMFWVEVRSDRAKFAQGLRKERGGRPIVPYVLRNRNLFMDPNSMMADIDDVLKELRKDIENVGESARERGGVDLVVLSMRALEVADGSSSVALPEWYPVNAGMEERAHVENLTWLVSVFLKDAKEEMRIDELCGRLHAIDKALVGRLRRKLNEPGENRELTSLWDRIKAKECPSTISEDVLDDIDRGLNRVGDVSSYRPSCRPGNWTIVELLWYKANTTAPNSLLAISKALAGALNVRVVGKEGTLAVVLGRPTSPVDTLEANWCLCLIVTLRSACQLTTAVFHSGEYPPFPVALLKSTSLDLRIFLRDAVGMLRRT